MSKTVTLRLFLTIFVSITIGIITTFAQNPVKSLNTQVNKLKIQNEDFVQRDMTDYVLDLSSNVKSEYKADDDEMIWMNYLNRPHPSVSTLDKYFKEAAEEFNVPFELLRTVAYVESNWTQIGPTLDKRWGIMALADNNGYCNSLKDAAKLINSTPEILKENPRENIRGYAALLAKIAGNKRVLFTKYEDWFSALTTISGQINNEINEMAVEEYYNIFERGVRSKTLWNEVYIIKKHNIDISDKLVYKAEREARQAPTSRATGDWYPGVTIDVSPNQSTRTAAIDVWMNHWIGTGTYAGAISWFNNTSSSASAHFVMKYDGSTTQMVSISKKAWHGNDFNSRSIGIEHACTITHPEYWQDNRLLKKSAEIAKYYCNLKGIPKIRRIETTTPGIYGHTDIPSKTKNCPGPMPWDTWMAYLTGGVKLEAILSSNNNKGVKVIWRADHDDIDGFRLYYANNDNLSDWKLAANESTLTASMRTVTIDDPSTFIVPPTGDIHYFKMTAVKSGVEGPATDVYARSSFTNGSGLLKVLIIDGFSRYIGSYTNTTHSFATTYFKGLESSGNYVVSTCSHSAPIIGTVNLSDYNTVMWFVGDESTKDHPFGPYEQELIKTYLEGGGNLFVTGSEIGYVLYAHPQQAADKDFYKNYLKALYTGDGGSTGRTPAVGLAGDFSGVSLPFGVAYGENSPDEITSYGGSTKIMKYQNDKYCGVSYKGTFGSSSTDGALVHLSFALETVTDNAKLTTFFTKLMQFFNTGQPIADFSITSTPTTIGTGVSFDASASSDPDGTISTYAWNFGDSSTGSGVNSAHSYSTAGTYSVTLTVTDNDGKTANATKVVVVNAAAGNQMIDDFEIDAGHFYRDPNFSGSTTGIGDASTAERVTTNPQNGVGSLKIVLTDDGASTDDWLVRLLSGSGSPSNNISMTSDGKLQLWLASSMTQNDAQIYLWLDDTDGIEESNKITIINDGAYHLYEWSLTDNSKWTGFTGNGSIDGANVTLDALMLTSPNASPWTAIYIDDVFHSLTELDTQAPTAPASLTHSALTQTSVNLTWTASTDNVAVTGYDVYKDGTLLVTTANTNYSVTGLTPSTAYSFYVKAKDESGNISSASNTLNVTTLSNALSYCSTKGLTSSDEWLQRVDIGTIDNNSGNNGGYASFTTMSTDLTKGTSVNFSLYPGWQSSHYDEAYVIWIDYNQDGDFDDAGEQVYTHAKTQNNPVNGSFIVPVSALNGNTTMRIAMRYNQLAPACGDYDYGETEDYMVAISGSTDTSAPTAPTSLTASSITQSSLQLSWTASTDNVGVADYDIYKGGVLYQTTTSTSYTVNGLTAGTSYSFYVKAKDASGNVSSASNTINPTTLSAGLTYCDSKGESVKDEWIERVRIGSINKTSGVNGGYADFTALSTNASQGSNQTITINPAWSGTVYDEGYAVWIDYNQNGDFNDAGELVWSKTASKNTEVSGTFTIPVSALIGNTRMRVSMSYNAVPATCGNFKYGEVEDYTINIVGSSDTSAPTAPTSLVASNITLTTLTLTWTASTDNIAVSGYTIYKDGNPIGTVASTSANVTGLTEATTYSFYVKAEDAAGNVSSSSNIISVTTTSNTATYCDSKGNSVNDEWIGRVVVGSIDNTSGVNAGYGDFTVMSASMGRNSSYTITIYPTWSGDKYDEAYSVWIDYNNDGDFEDAGEQVYTHVKTTDLSVSGSFTIPSSAILGNTRMRVSMKWNALPTPCEAFSYGEVEDYTINITSSKSNSPKGRLVIYPNPATNEVMFEIAGVEDYSKITVYSITGSVVKEAFINENDNRLDISNLPTGIYNVIINTGEKTINGRFIKQ